MPGRARAEDVAVVVVTYDSEAVVGACLEAIAGAFQGAGARPRVVVVDNASVDATAEVVRTALPSATFLRLRGNLGYAAAINVGIAAAGPADAVFVLNPDVRLAPGAAGPLLDALAEPGVGIAAPRLVDRDGDLLPTLRRAPSLPRTIAEAVLGGRAAGPLGEVVRDAAVYQRPGRAEWASGAALAIGRACQAEVGPWDETFFLYSEEVDFALRARDAGWALAFCPAATGVHLGGECETSTHLHRLLVANRLRFYRRRHGAVAGAAFRAALAAGEALRAHRPLHRGALVDLLGLRPSPVGPAPRGT